MGVSEVTAEIALAIKRTKSPLTSREACLLYLLEGMPLFRDVRRFDLWERAYQQVAPDEQQSETEKIIDALFWLGGDCMYGAYDAKSTREYYEEKLKPMLSGAGIDVPKSPDLSTW